MTINKHTRAAIFVGVALVAAVHAGRNATIFIAERAALRRRQIPRTPSVDHARFPAASPGEIEGAIGQAARRSRVRRLASVSSADAVHGPETTVEWESGPSVALTFLSELRGYPQTTGIQNISMITLDDGTSGVRVRATLVAVDDKPVKHAPMKTTLPRDVFRPLWKDSRRSVETATARLRRAEEERRRALERQDAERRQREATQALEAKRRRFETGFTLTGIANNGRENVAFVDAVSGPARTMTLRQGDTLEEASVEAIDERRGELRLNYKNQFSVVLRLGGAPAGNF